MLSDILIVATDMIAVIAAIAVTAVVVIAVTAVIDTENSKNILSIRLYYYRNC